MAAYSTHEAALDCQVDAAPDDAERAETQRRRRVARVWQVGLSFALDAAMLAAFAALGVCDWSLVALYFSLGSAATTVFWLLLRQPRIFDPRDPYLTRWQVAAAIGVQLVCLYTAPAMATVFFPLFFVIFAFAALRMSLAHMLAFLFAVGLALAPLFARGMPATQLPALDPAATLLLGVTLMLTLLRCTLIGYFGFRLRVQFYARQLAADAAAQALEARVCERTRALTRTNEELQEANRQLQAYSYAMAHEFRGPLRAINGYSALLGKEYEGRVLDVDAMELITRTRSASNRMAELVDGLAQLAAVGRATAAPAEVDLVAIASRLVAAYAAREPQRRIEWVHPPSLPARADPALIEAGLRILIDNAWKFTARMSHPRIELGSHAWNGTHEFFVRDNGAGFDRAYADKLFGIFQRLHAEHEYEGSGVGLAVLERIVTLHGGRVRAEGAPGEGATFYFTLGAAPAAA